MKRAKDGFTNCTDVFEERYYIINKRLLCLIGQWPYLPFKKRCIRTVFLTLFTFSLLIPQIMKMLQSWNDIDLFIECFSPVVTNVGCSVKLLNLFFYSKELKRLLDQICENWESMRPYSAELQILRKYGQKGRIATLSYIILINSIVAAWISMPLLTVLLDYIVPLNESRPHLVLFQTDYKLDPDEYFYPILLHGSVVCVAAIQIYVSNDTLYMVMAQHACGMIEVLRYRLENITKEGTESHAMFKSYRQEDAHYQRICHCLNEHKRVVQFLHLLESTCEWLLVAAVGLTMLIMSCTGARTVAKGTATQDVIRFTFFALAQVVHLFCNTLPGHWIMCSSSGIQDSAFNSGWYLMSGKSRMLIVLLIRQCAKPCVITAGKLYVMSMENFCSVLQTSMSYLTMLTSMR